MSREELGPKGGKENRANEPSMRVEGNMGDSSMSRPPKPQPISANSTLGVGLGNEDEDEAVAMAVESEEDDVDEVASVGRGGTNVG